MNRMTVVTSKPGAVTSAARPIPPCALLQDRATGANHHQHEHAEQLGEQPPPLEP